MNRPRPTSLATQKIRLPHWQQREALLLGEYAMHSRDSQGRDHPEEQHDYRSPFQRDRDRILHSSAFRRLSGKMQVFTGDMGDYHRTRLTHTQEVSSIARTIGRVLRLNEDLIEALALLHDIGHPPFGHSGEDALNECMSGVGGFSHNRFALELAQKIEQRYTPYAGLNLSAEVLAGQHHRSDKSSELTPLLEVQIVDAADSIAYDAHDLDDALQLGLLQWNQLRGLSLVDRAMHGAENTHGPLERMRPLLVHRLIDLQIDDFLERSLALLDEASDLDHLAVREVGLRLGLSSVLETEKKELENFLFDQVYRHPRLIEVRRRAATRLTQMYRLLVAYPNRLPKRFHAMAAKSGVEIAAGHYLAGMTDRFCDDQYTRLVELGRDQADDWS